MKEKKVKGAFIATMMFFIFIFAFFTFFSKNSNLEDKNVSSWQEEISKIDRQIDEIKEIMKGYEIRSLNHENQALKLNLIKEEGVASKRHFSLAKENKHIVKKLSKDIFELQTKKKKILKEHE